MDGAETIGCHVRAYVIDIKPNEFLVVDIQKVKNDACHVKYT